MVPMDNEDFSTLHPSETPPPPVRPLPPKPAPVKLPPAPTKPVENSILSSEPLVAGSRIKLSERAQQVPTPRTGPLEFLDTLIRLELFEDATRYLAHALPPFEAIGWAYLCACQVHPRSADSAAEDALAAAADWMTDPAESSRIAAMKAAEIAGLETPAGRTCAAVFLTGPDGDLPISIRKLPNNSAAIGVSAAVLCAAVWGDAAKRTDRFRRFLTQGRQVACGARLWEEGNG